MERPLVSIVMCVYNGEKYLKEQVDSILAQTYRPIELIIADDASTDNTKKILGQYENNPFVRLIYREKNIGLAKNFSLAAERATGAYIAFSDQDDIWIENKIEKLVNAIPGKHLVYSDSFFVDESGNSLNKKLSDIKKMYTGTDSRCYMFYSCVWGHGMLITKELLHQSLPMAENIHHDIWLVFKAFQNGGIFFYNETLTRYRRHNETTSIAIPQKMGQRKNEQRFYDYRKNLHWIQLMAANEREEFKPFFNEMAKLYSLKEKRSYVWPLVFFMLKHRKAIFQLTYKNFFSQLVEILKQARGEKL